MRNYSKKALKALGFDEEWNGKISNLKVAFFSQLGTRKENCDCAYCFPDGIDSSKYYNRFHKRNWKYYRRNQYKIIIVDNYN